MSQNNITTVVRTAPQQDLMNELNFFLKGVTKKELCNEIDLTKSALILLKCLPSTKIAVLEYLCSVFENAAKIYVQALETEINTGKAPLSSEDDELIVSDIHSVLSTLIADNPVAWAPLISSWSLELLGEISSKYSGRAHFSSNLNETLQLWMSCRGTRTLMDINTKCLSSLIHSNTEACISALLDTSVKHSPHFDWVVAHVGSCFPNTVITRVLSVGLKDFCQNKSYDQECNAPKLKSVVGILGHLAGSHVEDIRKAILDMFVWSLRETLQDTDIERLQKKATVPYILQLIYLSSTLLSSICIDIRNFLTVDVIVRLYYFVENWCKYFGTPEALEELVTSLILRCENNGIQLIKLMFQCILIDNIKTNEEIKNEIVDKTKDLLTIVLQEMEESVRHNNAVGLIQSLSKESTELVQMLLSTEKVISDTAAQIVVLLGHLYPSLLITIIQSLLKSSTTDNQLILLLKILTNDLIDKTALPYSEKGGHFSVVVEQILNRNIQKFCTSNEENLDLSQMWHNLLKLLRWEKSDKAPILKSRIITRSLEANLTNLTALLSNEVLHMHVIADILDTMEIPVLNASYNPPIAVVLNLTQSTVNYFFACCKDNGTASKLKGYKKVNNILKRLCLYSKVAKVLALRELLERALFRCDNILFGAKINEIDNDNEKMLLKQNKKISKTIPLTKHSTVFNGGIIGTGKRKSVTYDTLPSQTIAHNKIQLINAIKACCALPDEHKYTDMSWDSMTLLSLLLVQFVSPDVMYNGLPWPEEEFSKVTMERDLFIRRLFTNTPLLWDILSFVAVYRPAVCYCSVLIRALTATLINQWKSMGEQSKDDDSENYKNLMYTTIQLIDIMALGQLLPPPLSSIRDVLPYLKSFEIVAVLRECVWCYLRDHIPSPALFGCDSNGVHWRDPIIARPPDIYTNTLRIIMQRNIKSLGHMYAQMFINVPSHDS
ncbi:integrator complex subunit 5 isoform X1 [Diorhabda carinulata]|uniref:integrator complex subunit 5 isoform X1 n=2 Tax=Diorhabda carinulata TaxID=1163345 RepID=UPI0025A1673C|nr:integrator complex subunit 5 isoform X1 [Diorhabda carinulata]